MTTSSAEVGIIIKAIDTMVGTLTDRIVKTETDVALQIVRFTDSTTAHHKAIELRLDQLVDITKEQAVMRAEAAHRDDKIIALEATIRATNNDNEESLKRMHLRLDAVAEKHETLRTKFNMAFWIGSGMWAVVMFWYNLSEPVKKVEELTASVREMKDDLKDLKAWRFEQAQNTRFHK